MVAVVLDLVTQIMARSPVVLAEVVVLEQRKIPVRQETHRLPALRREIMAEMVILEALIMPAAAVAVLLQLAQTATFQLAQETEVMEPLIQYLVHPLLMLVAVVVVLVVSQEAAI
jgi:hypothetical protein